MTRSPNYVRVIRAHPGLDKRQRRRARRRASGRLAVRMPEAVRRFNAILCKGIESGFESGRKINVSFPALDHATTTIGTTEIEEATRHGF